METKKRETELNIKDLGTVFLRCWWIMLLIGVLVGGAVYAVLFLTHTNEYTATASIYVMREAATKATGADEIQTQSGDVSISNNIKADVIEAPLRRNTLYPIMEELRKQNPNYEVNETNYQKLKKAISTESEEDEHIVYISVTAKEPETAKTLAEMLVGKICVLFNEEMFENERYVKIWDTVALPEKPSNPISKVLILLVTIGTMLVVYLVFFILFLVDDKINDAEDVENYLHVSLLGQIPNRRETSRRRKKYGGYYYAYKTDKPGETKNPANKEQKGGAAK